MFRQIRSDTTVETIQDRYRINLNCRKDALIGNILQERGFDSLSQLLMAYYGNLSYPASKRRVFVSFHAEDLPQVGGFRLMLRNPKLDFDLHDGGLREAINSERSSYIKSVIRDKINRVSVLICLIGNGTAWRDWVDWEIGLAAQLGKGICGIRLKGSRGRTPPILNEISAPIAGWDIQEMIKAIECAAARRN